MSRKWAEREGLNWVQKGIITNEQFQQILQQYPNKRTGAGLLPILGSILIGLGILSFVAANWQFFPQITRLLFILLVMVGFYWAGERFQRRDQREIGIALTGVGLISFGAGIILIAQMYQLSSANVLSFVLWGVIGIVLTYVYQSRFLYLISLLVLVFTQVYSTSSLHTFSYSDFIVLFLGLGIFAWKKSDDRLFTLVVASIFIQSLLYLGVYNFEMRWFILVPIVIYSLADIMTDLRSRISMQMVSLLAAYMQALFTVLLFDQKYTHWNENQINPIVFIPIFLFFFFISLWGKKRKNQWVTTLDWLLFLPLFYISQNMDIAYLLVMSLFSLYVLLAGFKQQSRSKINTGTVLFLVSIMVAYTKLTWGFLDKSVFFLIGGILLLGLSWFLNKQKKEILTEHMEAKGGNSNEEQ